MNPGDPKETHEPVDPIEARLQRMRPAALPPELMARLLAAQPQPRKVVPFPRSRIIGLALAAALVAAFFAWRLLVPEKTPIEVQPIVAEFQVFAPVESERYVEAREIGVLIGPDQQPYRLMHCAWIDRDVYASANSPNRAEAIRPQEVIIPVAMEIY